LCWVFMGSYRDKVVSVFIAFSYYFAGVHGLLVAGTGNKVEDFGVGFYTKIRRWWRRP
jgi:hypothetical protein